MDGLIEGRIVHYVMPDGNHVPAIVVKVWNPNGTSNLQIFTDGVNSLPSTPEENRKFDSFGFWPDEIRHGHLWITSIRYSEEKEPGTWHWIEKA